MNKSDLITMTIYAISILLNIISARREFEYQISQLREDIKEIKKNLYIMEAEDKWSDAG